MNSLLPKDEFIGITNVAHLAAGGETPPLRSHLEAIGRFLCDKGDGMPGRERMADVTRRAKQASARLLGRREEEIAFLASASEGLFVAASGIDWRAGDNVVVERAEYPSVRYVWQSPGLPAELRTVGSGPVASLSDFREAVNARTRVIAVSHVSYLTGVRRDLAAFRELADRVGARLSWTRHTRWGWSPSKEASATRWPRARTSSCWPPMVSVYCSSTAIDGRI